LLLALIVVACAPGCRGDYTAANRQALFEALTPVKLSNCEFERVGDKHDGGYVLCGNLVNRAEVLYSYGINATDNWGCTLSARLRKPVHQYDCFNVKRPPCADAAPLFHEECVGAAKATVKGRPYDAVASHIRRNGDSGKRLVMKMDVEGSEWEAFLAMPESALQQIDQLSVEFHGVEDARYSAVIHKLRRVFHLVNVHYNNYACDTDAPPFPATVFEVLFVNKNLGLIEEGASPVVPNPLDSPNGADRPDCQLPPE
jgi:hypothetical protein